MQYQTVPVSTGTRAYPIFIGRDLFSQPEVLLSHIVGCQVLIVTQENIADYYLASLQIILKDYQCDVFYLPQGEHHKNLVEWEKILTYLLQKQHDRNSTILSLGGGMVGDMAGFAAACYQRGINYIQTPTTLIAQVDAAIGGKTAVNHQLGKNMFGLIYQPCAVFVDINFLQSLPYREYKAGLAEVIKHALIASEDFFYWLETNIELLLAKDEELMLHAISQSIKIKAEIVSRDENEQGLRNILNFGHSFGHVLEIISDYKILHGEAVAIGMRMATELSAELGWITNDESGRILNLLNKLAFSIPQLPSVSVEEMMTIMRRDKKNRNKEIHLILLKSIGNAIKTSLASEKQITAIFENLTFEMI